ncbi:MAG TPA: DUF4252 domain-containing protein [Puia sp.]|jgi:hypothetical protein|nr:DUF4252 domain-containing protein [Puia sp.]
MYKMMLPLMVLLTTVSACAQSPHLDEFYRKYHDGADGVDKVSMDPGFLFSASFSGNSDDTGKSWMHRITSVRCLIIDGKKSTMGEREWSDLGASLQADRFEEWFSARKGKSRFQLLSRDGKDNLEDIACLIIGDDGGGLFFHLRGHFTAADKARIESALQGHDSE